MILFYFFVISHGLSDIVEFILSEFFEGFYSNEIAISFEDLNLIRFGIQKILLLFFIVPISVFQIFFFIVPALCIKERLLFYLFFFNFLGGYFFSIFSVLIGFLLFCLDYRAAFLGCDLSTSCNITKIFLFFLILLKCVILFFFPLNLFLVLSFHSFLFNPELIKLNSFIYIYIYLLNLAPIEDNTQFISLFIIQLGQLEVLILITFLFLNITYLKRSFI